MRFLLILLVVFSMVVSLSFWSNHMLKVSTVKLMKSIDEVVRDIEKGNWEGARQKMTGLEKDWDREAGWWPTLLDHQEMDNIEFAMARVEKYVETRDTALSLGQLSELKLMLRHIPEKEALSVKNIF